MRRCRLLQEVGAPPAAAASGPREVRCSLMFTSCERLRALESLLREVAGSGIESTNPGKYHVVQISLSLWSEIRRMSLDAPMP